ncbi:RNA polymerase sigma factor FecI [Nitrospira sp. KM1]|uniref:RNA polymerase sigma factor n=1 Tax=Nitrospira sp. KM1 TaxID=1936990 RepID=UPI0013A74D1D|nr:sigma-70 family RNA polymerase sigma factor [Nitrospira sp. KM1]BCA56546.1 RNA polymerase sigma factor FecI [Nitrospira sp. KM1]
MAVFVSSPYDSQGIPQSAEASPSTMATPETTGWTLGEYARYYRELLGFLTARLRCPHEAADMAQETFARALAHDDPAAIRQPRAFLYRIARNLAVDSARKQSIRTRHLIDLTEVEDAPSATPLPDHVLEKEQLRRALDQTILKMPPRRREVFLLYRFGGLSQAEIAEKLDISTSMVERHLMKAMTQCKERLQAFR